MDTNDTPRATEEHDAAPEAELHENDLEQAAGGFVDALLDQYKEFKRGFRDAINDGRCY